MVLSAIICRSSCRCSSVHVRSIRGRNRDHNSVYLRLQCVQIGLRCSACVGWVLVVPSAELQRCSGCGCSVNYRKFIRRCRTGNLCYKFNCFICCFLGCCCCLIRIVSSFLCVLNIFSRCFHFRNKFGKGFHLFQYPV